MMSLFLTGLVNKEYHYHRFSGSCICRKGMKGDGRWTAKLEDRSKREKNKILLKAKSSVSKSCFPKTGQVASLTSSNKIAPTSFKNYLNNNIDLA